MSDAENKPAIPSSKKPRSDFNAVALVGTALVTVLLVLVNYIASRRYERWDLTQEKLFTLSGRTEQVLTELDKPVELYLFLSSREPNFQELRELLTRYQSKTDKLTVHTVDPDREPAKFRMLAEKFGVRVALQESGQTEAELAVLALSGDKRWSVTRDDLVDIDMDSLDGQDKAPKVNVKTEQALTGAIVQVTSGRPTKVCITEGHGEWTIDGGGERNLSVFREELKRENINVEALATRGKTELPKDCDAVFVLGPMKGFSAEEGAALKRYLEAGGNVLLLVDPIISGEQLLPSGLEDLAKAYGVSIDPDVVVELEESRLLSPSPVEHFLVQGYTDHKVVRPLAALGAPVVMQLARSISVAQGSVAEPLLKASDKAYGETSLNQLTAGDDLQPGEGDIKPPVTLAVAVDTRPEAPEGGERKLGGRMIIMGDSEWIAPQFIQQGQVANIDLLSSVTGYLTEREALVSIAPRKINAQSIVITEEGLLGVFLRVVVLMPLAVLVLGVGVWWQRRQ